ncbi:DUF916 and DUF3324 domain-containing protein [Enterococcus sp. DIV1271a]|nr:DUF916 and DUF3324 domain-containing protein [Enterococcus sp. DIV1298c]MBO1300639.1 DUF916 and DUF3324 domain-containing protein [Enterococcus sp. DIV1271a]
MTYPVSLKCLTYRIGGSKVKQKRKIKWVLLFVLMALFSNIPVSASEFNFAITTTPPDSQIDGTKTYFDIRLDPEQTEELSVELRNDTDKEVKVDVSLNSVTTNSNVVVEYGENNIEKDDSLDIDIADYVEYPETVTLAPQSKETIVFQVNMPKTIFDGVLAGGITFKEITEEDQSGDDQQGLSIKNEYSYVVALLMRQTENKVAPNLILHEVEPGQINARNVILATLQNDQKTYINQVNLQTKITKKGNDTVLYAEDKEKLQIAPNTRFDFPTSLNGAALEPGEYKIRATVFANEDESGEFVRETEGGPIKYRNYWTFEKDFTIDGQVARELNAKDVTIPEDHTWMYLLIGALLLLLVVLLILWLLWRKKKNEEKED